MAYQFMREPLPAEGADKLAEACHGPGEYLLAWTPLDTGSRDFERCGLSWKIVLWAEGCLWIEGKGGPLEMKSKAHSVPVTRQVMTHLEAYFALHDRWALGTRAGQKLAKGVANRAGIAKDVTRHLLGHTWATLSLQRTFGHDRLETTANDINLTDEHVVAELHEKVGSEARREPAWTPGNGGVQR